MTCFDDSSKRCHLDTGHRQFHTNVLVKQAYFVEHVEDLSSPFGAFHTSDCTHICMIEVFKWPPVDAIAAFCASLQPPVAHLSFEPRSSSGVSYRGQQVIFSDKKISKIVDYTDLHHGATLRHSVETTTTTLSRDSSTGCARRQNLCSLESDVHVSHRSV